MPSRDDRFAEIAVRKGYCSKEQMDACRTMQAQDPDPAALGDILRFNGVLTDEQVAAVESALVEKPAPPEKAPPAAAPAAKTITATCIMCDTVIESAPDEGGRVRCGGCGTCFVPK